ncbi:uncharacterized protein LOC109846686 [Asparagus officinalis]|uniref:uncharacterized protein LOC109846686 n=1 Tax=Asparagus officinalis TaxID=4686 RepID=UPI00098E025E|nr:uncharacterized protein LOC109846686 [Asparagus officinalis]
MQVDRESLSGNRSSIVKFEGTLHDLAEDSCKGVGFYSDFDHQPSQSCTPCKMTSLTSALSHNPRSDSSETAELSPIISATTPSSSPRLLYLRRLQSPPPAPSAAKPPARSPILLFPSLQLSIFDPLSRSARTHLRPPPDRRRQPRDPAPSRLSPDVNGVLNTEERSLPGIQEDLWLSTESTSTLDGESYKLENLEGDLFENERASIHFFLNMFFWKVVKLLYV